MPDGRLGYAAKIEKKASGVLLQYASLPSLEKMSTHVGAFSTKLDDQHGALTRQGFPVTFPKPHEHCSLQLIAVIVCIHIIHLLSTCSHSLYNTAW